MPEGSPAIPEYLRVARVVELRLVVGEGRAVAELRRRPGRKWFQGRLPDCLPRPDTRTLRDGRPPPSPRRSAGTGCRAPAAAAAEEIACILRDYWVCPGCRRAHEALAAYGGRAGEAMKGRRVRR